MVINLALRNSRRSIKDYGIYFFTLVLGVCVFYMFNSIYAQQAMASLSSEMSASVESIEKVISYLSIFVAVVLGFLIVYANSFFIKRRKKEMGIYFTLGMEKEDVSKILLMETSIVAVMALIVGLVTGIFLSQFMSVFTARIFEADMSRFAFVFSLPALIKSVVCFFIIHVVVIMFNLITLSRCRLIDLIYGDKQNESLKVKNGRDSLLLFIISVIMLALAYYLILTVGFMDIGIGFFMSIILGTGGTLLFFYSLSALMMNFLKLREKIYYKNLNMFVIRQLGSKIKSNFISLSVVSIVLLFTIGIFAIGYGMQEVLSKELRRYAGYDFTFSTNEENEREFEDFIKATGDIKEYVSFPVYSLDITYGEMGVPLRKDVSLASDSSITVIALSDYNKTMVMSGEQPVTLNDDQYMITTKYKAMDEYGEGIVNNQSALSIDGTLLKPLGVFQTSPRNGSELAIFIVPDKYTKSMEKVEIMWNLNCSDKKAVENLQSHATDIIERTGNSEDRCFNYYISRTELLADAVGEKATVSFIAVYLGIVFMITCAAILAVQQLTETEDNKARYSILRKMGVEKSMINKALFIQILCYFLMPLILAVVHGYFGLTAAIRTLNDFGNINIASTVFVTAIFITLFYSIYFLVTYGSCRNIIEKN